MSFQPSLEARECALSYVSEADRPIVAARLGVPVERLIDVAFEALAEHEKLEIERGDEVPLTGEEAEIWAEHLACEYA